MFYVRTLIAVCLLAVAIPAEAGPLKKLIARLKPHAATQQQSKSACPCNSAACTGKPGCACGDAGCTCNGPTQVAKQDQPRATVKQRSLLRRAAGKTDPPQSPAAPLLEQAPAAPAGPEEKAVKKSASVDLSTDESRILTAINNYRSARNLSPLSADPLLQRIARKRVGVFNHHAFGMWSWEQAHREGFHGPVTDNLAQGYESPESAVGNHSSGWGDETGHSIGHDRQMKGFTKINGQWVNQHFNLCGMAHQGQNWIAVFGRRED